MSNTSEDTRAKFSQTHRLSDCHRLPLFEPYGRGRVNVLADVSAAATSPYAFSHISQYQQLTERVRELENELVTDFRRAKMPLAYATLTPSPNMSATGLSGYSRPYNFPIGLMSPHACAPRLQFGFSPKIFERVHQIPERFWIDWRQKQIQQRIDELKSIKNNSNASESATMNRRRSLQLLHEAQRRKTISSSIDEDLSSSDTSHDQSLVNFDQRSLNEAESRNSSLLTFPNLAPCACEPPSTLDRSRLTIFLPFSHNAHDPSFGKPFCREVNNTHANPAADVSAG